MAKPTSRGAAGSSANKHDVARRLFFRLYQATNLMHKTGNGALAPHGTTTQQLAVLGALAAPRAQERGLTTREMVEHLMISRQSLSVIIERLVRAGLVERVRPPGGGRARNAILTDAGREKLVQMEPTVKSYYDEALADFSVDESRDLLGLLERLGSDLAKL